jgi:hypothetical protein
MVKFISPNVRVECPAKTAPCGLRDALDNNVDAGKPGSLSAEYLCEKEAFKEPDQYTSRYQKMQFELALKGSHILARTPPK